MFDYAMPLFSRGFTRNNRKAKLVRMGLIMGGPVELNGVRYSHMRDRQEAQELYVADW